MLSGRNPAHESQLCFCFHTHGDFINETMVIQPNENGFGYLEPLACGSSGEKPVAANMDPVFVEGKPTGSFWIQPRK
jgi:hypothetical protein